MALPEAFTPQFLNQLEMFRINARRMFLGSKQGGHLSPKRGHGIEFSDYRKYELGDNPRHIDWGVYARTERLYVKRYQEEQDLSVIIILDSSASMTTPSAAMKWEYTTSLALALTYVASMERDTITLATLGKPVSAKLNGAKAIHSAARYIAQDVSDLGSWSWIIEIKKAVSRIRFPGVAVLISDFLEEPEVIHEACTALRARNLDIVAIQLLDKVDTDPLEGKDSGLVIDSETGDRIELALTPEIRAQYSSAMQGHNNKIQQIFAESQVAYAQALTSHTLSEILIDILPSTGLIR